MSPIKTEHCNFVFTAPPGTEDTVMDLHCRREEGVTTSWWMPSAEERIAVSMGCAIRFQVFGEGHPVVSLDVASPGMMMEHQGPTLGKERQTALRCAQIIEKSGMHPSSVPVVIGSLINSLSIISNLPQETLLAMCAKAAAAFRDA